MYGLYHLKVCLLNVSVMCGYPVAFAE